MEKLNLKDYKITDEKKISNKGNKNYQRLAFQIAREFNDWKMSGFWYRVAKKNYAFLEDKFLKVKKMGLKNPAAYLMKILKK